MKAKKKVIVAALSSILLVGAARAVAQSNSV
jgi:hypothetical protein